MNITKCLLNLMLALALSAGLSATGIAQASGEGSDGEPVIPASKPGELYLASDDPMADLATGLDAARDTKRLLLVVMGANWCHDSRALAARLFEEPLSTTVNENYETLFVDVGYLNKGKDIITHLGIPVYYATPTVLIIDPASGQVINAHNRHQWANAANIDMEESLDYFQQYADTDLTGLPSVDEADTYLQELLTEIDAFEQVQAERLYQAYAIVGPMLKAYKEGDEEAFSDELWNEVRDYRYKVPVDIETLRAEAVERVAGGETDIKLDYPVYPAFPWEP